MWDIEIVLLKKRGAYVAICTHPPGYARNAEVAKGSARDGYVLEYERTPGAEAGEDVWRLRLAHSPDERLDIQVRALVGGKETHEDTATVEASKKG